MELWEYPGTKIDGLVLWASRAEVEVGDISHALAALRKLLKPEIANRLKGRLFFEIRGYIDDPRDLWEIPEVCAWMQALDKEFPHWFYFMDLGPHSTLALIAFSLCRYEKISNAKRIPPNEIQRFLLSHLAAMNRLSKELGESQTENGRRSMDITRFFFPESEISTAPETSPAPEMTAEQALAGSAELFGDKKTENPGVPLSGTRATNEGTSSDKARGANDTKDTTQPGTGFEFAFESFIHDLQSALLLKRNAGRLKSFQKKYHIELAFVCMYLYAIGAIAGDPDYHADPPTECDICKGLISSRGFFVDGITDGGTWANMCAQCYLREGHGIGWGVGQWECPARC